MLPIPTARAGATFFGCLGIWLVGLLAHSWAATTLGSSVAIGTRRSTPSIVKFVATPTGMPTSACSSAPGLPAPSRGEKFQVVGAMIW